MLPRVGVGTSRQKAQARVQMREKAGKKVAVLGSRGLCKANYPNQGSKVVCFACFMGAATG